MTHPFDILKLDHGAHFISTPCPGTKETSVLDALTALKAAGADAVITMMTMPELMGHGTDTIPDVCKTLGISWFHLPVEDSCAPEAPFEQAYAAVKDELSALMNAGKTVVIHCHGGSGRTGMMAAILMLAAGYGSETVRAKIQSIRPKSLKSAVQVAYLETKHGYQNH